MRFLLLSVQYNVADGSCQRAFCPINASMLKNEKGSRRYETLVGEGSMLLAGI